MSAIPNPHPVYEWLDPPEGFHIEWVEDTNRRRPATPDERERKCRGAARLRCPGIPVMAIRRSNGWWLYCDQHMYGSRLVDGKVLSRRVVPDAGVPATP